MSELNSDDVHTENTGIDPSGSNSWWSRKCGAREVLYLALPLVISTMSFVVMQFCDRLFLTWHSRLDLAASLPAGALAWTATSLPLGIAIYANTFVAQYEGAALRSRIGRIVWQAIWIGIVCVPVFLLSAVYAVDFFTTIGHSGPIVEHEADYYRSLSLGSGALVINAALSAFFIGRGKTTVVMVVDILCALLNIVLDYYFIFGYEGSWLTIPEGGIFGAGLATSIAVWTKLLILAVLFALPRYRQEFGTLSDWRPRWRSMKQMFRFGLPNGLQFLVEGMAITLFVLIIARISEDASAATSLAFSINMIVFVPIFGLGIAVATMVGQQIGEGHPELAARATWTALALGGVYTAVFSFAYVVFPHAFLMAHGAGAEEFEVVESQAVAMLAFVAVYCFFDTIQLVFVSAIKGAGDTVFVVGFTVVSSIAFILTGHFGAERFSDEVSQVHWWWVCLTGWIMMLAVAYSVRFLQGRWRTMTVIEAELLPANTEIAIVEGGKK